MHLPAFASVALAAITSNFPCHPTETSSSLSASSVPSTVPPVPINTAVALQLDLSESTALSPTASLENLELREIVQSAAATQAATQYPTLSTDWVETSLAGGGVTWVPVIYTQTFPSVYEAWPTAASGEIGLGTISGTVGVVRTSTPKWSGAERKRMALGGVVAIAVSMAAMML